MIKIGTKLNVADNSGAKMVKCFNIPGGTRKRTAFIGDIITVVVKKAEPRRDVKTHQVAKAVVVRQKKNFRRADGSYISFDENACCIVGEKKEPKGNRILGPVPRELKEKGFDKITTLARDVV